MSGCASTGNPCRQAYIDYLGGPDKDRFSWDPLTTLVAVRGPDAVPGVEDCDDCNGRNEIWPDCSNHWVEEEGSSQSYLRLRWDELHEAGAAIDSLLCQAPGRLYWSPPPPPPSPLPASPSPTSPPPVRPP
eukprot:7317161-Prymnesium_polylepis.1